MKKRSKPEKAERVRSKTKATSVAEKVVDPVERRKEWLAIFFLLLIVLIPYAQVLTFGFIEYDDGLYVFENTQVMKGLNASTFVWAFTNNDAMYFHPLTWLSHLLDSTIYGMKAGGHHFTSLLIHTIDTVLLFWVLRRMTGLLWASVFTAALFGVHPLHVESVAWVAERKDVLSAFFWIAGMGVYARYVRTRSIPSYLLMAVVFVLAIMSKPMVVTFPCALLLLDYWPLNRFGDLKPGREWFVRAKWLALEKLPLFALSLISAASTLIMQKTGGNIGQSNIISVALPDRIANAFVAYAVYVWKTLWPFQLALIYPHPGARPIWQTGLALLVLVCITVPVVMAWRRSPCLIVGWLWFLGTLVPVIELVQAGDIAYADRYTYLPSIGLSMMLFYGVASLVQSGRLTNKIFVGAGTFWVVALMICTALQAHLWRDSTVLFNHALKVTSNNFPAHNALGFALMKQNRLEEAEAQFRKSLEISDNFTGQNSLGFALMKQNKPEEAKVQFLKALKIKPDNLDSNTNLGVILMDQGNLKEAEAYLRKAFKIKPDDVDSLNNLGILLLKQEHYTEAKEYLQKAIELQPDFAKAHLSLGNVMTNLEKLDEAKNHFLKALELMPNEPKALGGLGFVLIKQKKYDEAKTYYLKAIELQPDMFEANNNLGLILMNQGKLDEAKTYYLKAIELQPDSIEAHNRLGMLLVNQEKLDEAKVQFQKVLEIKPDSGLAYEGMGTVLTNKGQLEEARANFLKAVELEPDSARIRYGLGSVLANQGKLEEAVASFLKAIELQPDFVNAHVNLGVVLKLQGRKDEAKACFQKALQIAPNSAAARQYLNEMP